jgi:hypothetical protein
LGTASLKSGEESPRETGPSVPGDDGKEWRGPRSQRLGTASLKSGEESPRETGPSVPGDDKHAEVKGVQKPFGLLDEASFDAMKNILMFLTPTHGALSYGSENDIAGFVKTLVSRIMLGRDLSQLEVHSELGTFNIRPDLWVITRGGVPIGVIQVKKPDVQGEKIQGELYDFMRHLPNFYGESPLFGIITNFVSWRVAWLPDKDGNFDEVENRAAEPVVWFPDDYDDDQNDSSDCASVDANANLVEGTSPMRQTASKINPLIHKAEEEDSEVDDEQEEFLYNDDSDRFFHVSKIFHRTDSSCYLQYAGFEAGSVQ